MKAKKFEEIFSIIDGKHIDFYLEDDMFELEGIARLEEDKLFVRVLDGVGHMLKLSGNELEFFLRQGRLFARRTDTGKEFETEINRIYTKLEIPQVEEFLSLHEIGVEQFFQKSSDTLVWKEENQDSWMIECNKVNMCFSGERSSYDGLQDLFQLNHNVMKGEWQAVHYHSEVEWE